MGQLVQYQLTFCCLAYFNAFGYNITFRGEFYNFIVGLERGPLSLVSTIEELLGRKK
jgi:hypothetical protein